MISAIYARKAAVLIVLGAALVFAALGSAAEDPGDVPYEHYQQGRSRVTEYFVKVHEEFAGRFRVVQILAKCGYKKEADELDAKVVSLVKKKLDALVQADIKSEKLPSIGALFVAHEGAFSMWVGYGFGFRKSFEVLSDLLPARTYEAVCKDALKEARERLEEASK